MTKEEILEKFKMAAELEDEQLGKEVLMDVLVYFLDGVERVVLAVEQIAENGK